MAVFQSIVSPRSAPYWHGPVCYVFSSMEQSRRLGAYVRRRELIAALGGAVVLPLVARAQAMKSYRLGYLALLPGEDTTLAKPLLQRLQEVGYRKGMNMILEDRSADARAERLPP